VRALLKIVILILFILGIGLLGIGLVNLGIITTEPPKIESGMANVTLIIDYGNNRVDTYYVKTANATVFSVLMQAAEENNFTVGARYYDEYQSYYVYSINSVVEGKNNKYWQYYLNGVYGMVGASLQPVKDNDIIEWKYQEPKIG
jgi:uncharacterized membrane protein YiaA